MVYFKLKDFDIFKFSQHLKLPKQKQIQLQKEYEKNSQKFIKKINDEEMIDVGELIELVSNIKGKK